jgi:hypothetical protein
VEPFDRQTKLFVKARTFGFGDNTYHDKYGIFHILRNYHKLNLQGIDTYLIMARKVYDFMVQYYTEKADQEALDILAKVVRKPTDKTITEPASPVESPVVSSIEPSVVSPVESPSNTIDRAALNKLCDEMIQQATQIKALLKCD